MSDDRRGPTSGGVADVPQTREAVDARPVEIDGSTARPARVYDYVAGGRDNFSADRRVAEHAAAAYGEVGLDLAKEAVKADREFLVRAVRYLVAEAGIRQILDIGTGIPHQDNLHEIAQRLAPESRVVYVDDDAVVLAHAHRLRRSTPQGRTAYIDADLRQPDKVLGRVPETLDLAQPVAVTLFGTLHHVCDEDGPHELVRRFVDAVPSGSYLALSHITNDVLTEAVDEAARRINETGTGFRLRVRGRADVLRFFDGLELVEPGLVTPDEWRHDDPPARDWEVPYYVGVGRKP
ncbi:MAG TPA: SAM-dependent methyltransferase [Acidimicrobiales bacterium]